MFSRPTGLTQESQERTQAEIDQDSAAMAAQNPELAGLSVLAIEAASLAQPSEGLNILADNPEDRDPLKSGWLTLLTKDSSNAPGFNESTFEQRFAGQPVVEITPERNRANNLQVTQIADRMPRVRAWEIRRRAQEDVDNNARKNKASIFKRALTLITGAPLGKRQINVPTERQLIELECKIGGQLLGPVPSGHQRDFFCLDDKTWVWSEQWRGDDRSLQSQVIRYEVQPTGILKVQPGRVYKYIDGGELEDLAMAARMYYEQTMRDIYELDPTTGQPLTTAPPATIDR